MSCFSAFGALVRLAAGPPEALEVPSANERVNAADAAVRNELADAEARAAELGRLGRFAEMAVLTKEIVQLRARVRVVASTKNGVAAYEDVLADARLAADAAEATANTVRALEDVRDAVDIAAVQTDAHVAREARATTAAALAAIGGVRTDEEREALDAEANALYEALVAEANSPAAVAARAVRDAEHAAAAEAVNERLPAVPRDEPRALDVRTAEAEAGF